MGYQRVEFNSYSFRYSLFNKERNTMTPEYRLKLQSDAKRQQQERKDRQHHFDSQKHHLNNIHKNNYGQIQDLKRSNFYKTVETTLNKNRERELAQKRLNTALSNMSPLEVTNLNKKVAKGIHKKWSDNKF